MTNDFNLCPMCGSKNIKNIDNTSWTCPDCGFRLFNSVAAAVGIVIMDSDNNVLFEVRAKDPQKGRLAIPGGFVDREESAEEAAVRECREEIGLDLDEIEYICSFPNVYPYKGIEYRTCDFFFKAKLPAEYKSINDFISKLEIQKSEVLDLKAVKIDSIEVLAQLPIAFESTKRTLKKLLEQ